MEISAAFFTALFGATIGVVELASRHSDHRLAAISRFPSLVYILINAMTSLAALYVIDVVRPDWLGFTADGERPHVLWLVLTAGFGAAAFFRSSLFKLQGPQGEVAVGPAFMIDSILEFIDESVDRALGRRRMQEVGEIMRDVDFEKAIKALPAYCVASLKRIPADAQAQFGAQLEQLGRSSLPDDLKPHMLGLAISALTGPQVLREAVARLGATIKRPPTP